MKLEIGMYMRTTKGIIFKLLKPIDNPQRGLHDSQKVWITDIKGYIYTGSKFKKSSFDIIDLIDKGDLANGIKINYKEEMEHNQGTFRIFNDRECLYNEDIKSVITKEQLESMKYIIKENK